MDCESDSEEEVFWDSLSSIDEEIETLKEVNRDMSESVINTKANGTESKFEDELFEEVWGNIHMNKAIENELNLRRSTWGSLSRSRNTEDTEEIEKEEAGLETSETEAKKTSLGGKSPSKLNPTKIVRRQQKKIGPGKEFIANLILFSVIVGKVALGKEIGACGIQYS